LPQIVRHLDYAPLAAMLHRGAAFVHHGGIGSCALGLHSGVPQLVMPMAFDQHDNAARLVRLGVGATVAPNRFRVEAVADQLDRLLTSPDVRQTCQTWRERCAVNRGIDVACDALERLEPAR
jgi:UDP:flavonoid glycosyltransferase YjiC (YdhE family)